MHFRVKRFISSMIKYVGNITIDDQTSSLNELSFFFNSVVLAIKIRRLNCYIEEGFGGVNGGLNYYIEGGFGGVY